MAGPHKPAPKASLTERVNDLEIKEQQDETRDAANLAGDYELAARMAASEEKIVSLGERLNAVEGGGSGGGTETPPPMTKEEILKKMAKILEEEGGFGQIGMTSEYWTLAATLKTLP